MTRRTNHTASTMKSTCFEIFLLTGIFVCSEDRRRCDRTYPPRRCVGQSSEAPRAVLRTGARRPQA